MARRVTTFRGRHVLTHGDMRVVFEVESVHVTGEREFVPELCTFIPARTARIEIVGRVVSHEMHAAKLVRKHPSPKRKRK